MPDIDWAFCCQSCTPNTKGLTLNIHCVYCCLFIISVNFRKVDFYNSNFDLKLRWKFLLFLRVLLFLKEKNPLVPHVV